MSLAAVALAATLFLGVSAQTPFYQGALYLQPGNNSNKCLQTSNYNGAPVILTDCATNGSADQQWTFSGGSVKIYGGQKCLDVTDGNNVNGVKLQVWDCWPNSVNQQFYYTRDYRLAWTNHGKCTDLTDGSMANGNRIQLWDCSGNNPNQRWDTGYMFSQQPQTSQVGQAGTNVCGTGSSSSSSCQTLVINSVDDFCLWGPPTGPSTIGDTEAYEVAYCTKGGHGTRVMPQGTLKGVHFVKTPDYVQVTGVGDFTKIHVKAGDDGGELDNHGADGNGNPVGGLVYGTPFSTSGVPSQFHEWTNFMSATEFCIRACTGPNAAMNCNHIYDVMGCYWNMPANYDTGVFESCSGVDGEPMGVYGSSTWHQGVKPTPSAHPRPSSSQCTTTATVGYGS